MNETQTPLRVLIFKDSTGWVATLLEYNLVAQAERLEELFVEMQRMVVADQAVRTEGTFPLPPAPQAYHRAFGGSHVKVAPHLNSSYPDWPPIEYRVVNISDLR